LLESSRRVSNSG